MKAQLRASKMTPDYQWNGSTMYRHQLSKSAMKKYHRLKCNNVVDFRHPPVLAEKKGRGHYLFVPPEWGKGKNEFQVAMEQYANTPGVMRVI